MATNPLGEGTTNLSVNMPVELYEALKELAKTSNLRVGAYARLVLKDAAVRHTKLKLVNSDPVPALVAGGATLALQDGPGAPPAPVVPGARPAGPVRYLKARKRRSKTR